MELVREKGKSGVALTAGLASYDAPDCPFDRARRVALALGRPQGLAITAAYSEYDPDKMTSLSNNALVSVSVEHGRPDNLTLRWRYEDQPSRLGPGRTLDLAWPALGGKLQFSYTINPLAPDGKTVRLANQYDALLDRKLFGNVGMQLGYRRLDYEDRDDMGRYFMFKLAGGQETGGGALSLSYLAGDFCKVVGNDPPPGYTFDLGYSRVWGTRGKVTLSLQRRTAGPLSVAADDSTEGHLEYSMVF